MSDDQLQVAAKFWARQVLLSDDQYRQDGLDDVFSGYSIEN
jgi:hypothetical protein